LAISKQNSKTAKKKWEKLNEKRKQKPENNLTARHSASHRTENHRGKDTHNHTHLKHIQVQVRPMTFVCVCVCLVLLPLIAVDCNRIAIGLHLLEHVPSTFAEWARIEYDSISRT